MPKTLKLPNSYGSVTKLTGNRRKPYMIRKTIGYEYDETTDKLKEKRIIIGYAKTRSEALQILADYNSSPFDVELAKTTFKEVFERWSEEKYSKISHSGVLKYNAAYKSCSSLYDRTFKELKLIDLQRAIDTSGKNYPTMKDIKILFNQMYDYAIKNEICNKNFSDYVDIAKHKDKNPNKYDRTKFTDEEIKKIWKESDNNYTQILLMLIYTGVRVNELMDLKKENVFIKDQYFKVVESKTENGIRIVPIADKILPFFKWWYDNSKSEYLLQAPNSSRMLYRNYRDAYFKPIMEKYNMNHKIHDTRHTCISMLTQADVKPVTIKKIVGHSGAMSLTEKVYTHLDIQELLNAINKI